MSSQKLSVLLLTALVGSSQLVAQSQAERTAEVVEKCVQALGGEAAWRAIENLEVTGRHTSFGHTEPFLLVRKRPDSYRFDHNESSFKLTHAYDGRTAWWRTDVPLFSKAIWPVETPLPFTRAIEREAEFDMPFVNYLEKGHDIELIGETEYEGAPFWELRVTRRLGSGQHAGVERWLLDTATFLPVLRIFQGTYHGYYTEQINHFAAYREVAGVLLPHLVETELGNDYLLLEVASVRVNVEIDDAMFSRPLPAGMERLRTLAGRWRVNIESRDDPAVHPERPKVWQINETVSVIERRFDGSFLEEDIAVATPRPRRVRRQFTYDRFRDVFRIAYFDTFTNHLDVLEGQMTDGRLIVSNRDTDTTTQIYAQTFHTREIVHEIQPDSFRLDREISVDGGNTWQPDIRFTYTRMTGDLP